MLLRLRLPAFMTGLLSSVACIAWLVLQHDRAPFFRAYLFAFLVCLGLALGSLTLLMLHRLTGGDWGVRIGPLAASGTRTIPLLAILFIPVCLGMQELYPWARAGERLHNDLVMHRSAYLNPEFFIVRAGLYFVIWMVLGRLVTRPRPTSAGLNAAGLILYLFTMTHAGIDWVMSRDTDFYSTAFGFILTVGQTLSALAFAVLLVPGMPPPRVKKKEGPAHRPPLLNDLGNLLLTLVILWAYVSFMQLLVIWMGNSKEDNSWYLERGLGGGGDSFAWRMVGLALVLFHFFVPFYILLFRRVKQNSAALTTTAGILLAAHLLEQYWLIAPSDHDSAAIFDPHWLDAAALLAVGGLWFATFLFFLQREPISAGADSIPSAGEVIHE
jgi:hypothetical protein